LGNEIKDDHPLAGVHM